MYRGNETSYNSTNASADDVFACNIRTAHSGSGSVIKPHETTIR